MRDRVLEPAVADLQHEWIVSHSLGALASGYAAFWLTLVICAGRAATREALTPPSTAFLLRAAVAFAAGLGAATIFQLALIPTWPGPPALNWMTFGLTIARGLTLGVPSAILPALMYARRRHTHPRTADGFKIGGIAVLLTILVFGWLSPLGSRAYGMKVITLARLAGRQPGPGQTWRPELAINASPASKTWPELVRASRGTSAYAPIYQRESAQRAAFVVLAIVLAVAGWPLGGIVPEPPLWNALSWCAFPLFLTQGTNLRMTVALFAFMTALLKLSRRPSTLPQET